MAAAQMALAIEMNNRMKRNAAAMGVFLNVETQKKFMKMASNVELQKELQCGSNTLDIYRDQFENLHSDFLMKDQENINLQRETKRLQEQVECQERVIDNYTHWLQVWKDQHDDLEAEIRRLKGEPDPHAGYNAYGEAIGDSD